MKNYSRRFSFLLIVSLFFLLAFSPKDNRNIDPLFYTHQVNEYSVKNILDSGVHVMRIYPRAVALYFNYYDSAMLAALEENFIFEYNDFLVTSAREAQASVPRYLGCSPNLYYFSPIELKQQVEYLSNAGVFIQGFYCETENESGILTKRIEVKLKEGEVYHKVIDKLNNTYPLLFRGAITLMPGYFYWDIKTHNPEEIIHVTEAISKEPFVEHVQLQVEPCFTDERTK